MFAMNRFDPTSTSSDAGAGNDPPPVSKSSGIKSRNKKKKNKKRRSSSNDMVTDNNSTRSTPSNTQEEAKANVMKRKRTSSRDENHYKKINNKEDIPKDQHETSGSALPIDGSNEINKDTTNDDGGNVVPKKKRASRWGPKVVHNTTGTSPTTNKNNNTNNDNGDESSEAPSTTTAEESSDDDNSSISSSSSSAPSTTDDDDDDDDNDNNDDKFVPKLSSLTKVIAPEQKTLLAGIKRTKMTDEGMDDFDFDQQDTSTSFNNNNVDLTNLPPDIQSAMEICKLPMMDVVQRWNLAPYLKHNLSLQSQKSSTITTIKNFFPVQSLVIPYILSSERFNAMYKMRDVCVSAPTGSGKTLAFVLPILNCLDDGGSSNSSSDDGGDVNMEGDTEREGSCCIGQRRLRALVVLPSRDLAIQVYNVFEEYSQGSSLKIGLAIGQTDFKAEQKAIILGDDDDHDETTNKAPSFSTFSMTNDKDMLQYALNPFDVDSTLQAAACQSSSTILENFHMTGSSSSSTTNTDKKNNFFSTIKGGKSAIDVLVCTPGRLMDHLDKTPGFTLQHLRFLVIDEADRLVTQSYQNWIQRVVDAAHARPQSDDNDDDTETFNDNEDDDSDNKLSKGYQFRSLDPMTWRKKEETSSQQQFLNLSSTSSIGRIKADSSVCRPVQLRKLLFSATLTKDPQKLALLGLVNPKQYDAHVIDSLTAGSQSMYDGSDKRSHSQSSYSLPQSLKEYKVECTAEQKLLVLLAIILEQRGIDKTDGDNGIVVVFTSSIDSTHRLTRLLQLLWGRAGYGPPSSIAEFSSALSQEQRAELMKQCNNPHDSSSSSMGYSRIQAVICSDGMSRGMDIASVTAVVNYDVPGFAKTYVHRCGRTARAGRKGRAISILKGGQVGQFMKMRRLIENPDALQNASIRKDLVKEAMPQYQKCVRALRSVMKAEENGTLSPEEPLGEKWIPSA